MQHATNIKRTAALLLSIIALIAMKPPSIQAAYVPTTTTMKLGLFYSSTALPSANLQNVSGYGSGFEFGYYDSNRDFISTGAWTGENAISMVIDRNMTWHPGTGGGSGEYREGTEGPTVLGCFHIMLDAYYETFEQAKAAAEPYNESYVKYESGRFYVMMSNYATRADAESAISSRGLTGCVVNAGTSNTIAIVKTGTNQIVFEFDFGDARNLGVRPRKIDNERPETWFKGYRYCGGFQYAREEGELLAVINYVDIEEYVKGVIPYEMNNAWPMEALKAQACCARTFASSGQGSHNSYGFDLCVTEHCQVYRGRGSANARTDQAVEETEGMYITYNGELCLTPYASSNGGASENCENVWFAALPYLRGVIDPYEADVASRIPNYNWTITYTPQEITQRLRNRGTNCSTIVSMEVSAYTPTGNVLAITLKDADGRSFTFSKREPIISALGVPTQRFNIGNTRYEATSVFANDPARIISGNSQFYAIDSSGSTTSVPTGALHAITDSGIEEIVIGSGASSGDDGMINGVFTIVGSGIGHLVGMSQWGAYSMAEYHDMSYVDIIKFYFTGVEIG